MLLFAGQLTVANVAILSSSLGISFISLSIAVGTLGQSFTHSQRNSGPFDHRFSWMIALADSPLEASSAGLAFVPTYFHWHGDDCSRIAAIRLATNVYNLLSSLAM